MSVTLSAWTAGLWSISGEYKDPTGRFYRTTGYWAYVPEYLDTLTSRRANAVVAMFLEPLSGGNSYWLGASLACNEPRDSSRVQCLAVEGPPVILDLNFLMNGSHPMRGIEGRVELSEPESKALNDRWRARSEPRGHLVLTPFRNP